MSTMHIIIYFILLRVLRVIFKGSKIYHPTPYKGVRDKVEVQWSQRYVVDHLNFKLWIMIDQIDEDWNLNGAMKLQTEE